MNVTYSDLIQLMIFIVALVGLCYEIFKGKKQPPTTANSERLCKTVIVIIWGQAASLAFPFPISNIAHLAAGRKPLIFLIWYIPFNVGFNGLISNIIKTSILFFCDLFQDFFIIFIVMIVLVLLSAIGIHSPPFYEVYTRYLYTSYRAKTVRAGRCYKYNKNLLISVVILLQF